MKVFWAIIGLLLIGAVATLLWTDRGASSPKSMPTGGPAATTRPPTEPLPEPSASSVAKDSKAEAKPEPAPETKPVAKPEAKPEAGLEAGAETKSEAIAPVEVKPVPAPEATPEPEPTAAVPAETKPAETKSAEPNALENKPTDAAATPAANTGGDKPGDVLTAPQAAPLPAAKVEKKDDGSMLIDGRFTVKGAGTQDDPYVLPWELLTSAEEVYKPQQGKKELPGRIMMFDGTFVRLAGYVAYPMFVEQPRELLSMLNQWDGCCIGIPPTPYDAVEVKLAKVATANERLATYGTIEGKLGVKPYLAGDWLVGLYLMEEAKLSIKEYNVGS